MDIKERSKEFWDRRPCNIKHSSLEVGTKEYFDGVEEKRYFVEPHILKFAEFARWEGKRVLEIGCGIGTDGVNFARHGADYTGLELSEVSLNLTKQRFKNEGLLGRFILGDVESLSSVLKDEKFDLIYSFGVLHHTPSIGSALAQIKMLCSESTVFRLMVYAKHSYKNALILEGLDQPEAQEGCPIANTYSKEEMEDLLSAVNFRVDSIEQAHIFPWRIQKYVQGEYQKEDWFSAMPDDVFAAISKYLGWHLLITASPSK